ncbi:MAG: endonuclease, partial [Myxococcota bacterium]
MKRIVCLGLLGALASCMMSCEDPKVREAIVDVVLDEVGRELERRGVVADERVSNRGNLSIASFSTSRRYLRDIHGDVHTRTLYCDCRFDPQSKRVDLKGCGYQARKNKKRAERVEFEHVVPASRFGRTFVAWAQGHDDCVRERDAGAKRYKGRACAERVSHTYKLMQADMHNLFPAVGEVNGDRSNDPYGEVDGELRA